MISFLKKLWRNKRGNALVMAGAALPLIVGSAGLASDTRVILFASAAIFQFFDKFGA